MAIPINVKGVDYLNGVTRHYGWKDLGVRRKNIVSACMSNSKVFLQVLGFRGLKGLIGINIRNWKVYLELFYNWILTWSIKP